MENKDLLILMLAVVAPLISLFITFKKDPKLFEQAKKDLPIAFKKIKPYIPIIILIAVATHFGDAYVLQKLKLDGISYKTVINFVLSHDKLPSGSGFFLAMAGSIVIYSFISWMNYFTFFNKDSVTDILKPAAITWYVMMIQPFLLAWYIMG